MKKQSIGELAVFMGLVVVIGLGGCATQNEVTSHWRAISIVIDGSDSEWQHDSPQYYDAQQHITMRFVNNSKTFSLVFATSDRTLQQQLKMMGLSVWLDPQGGNNKVFGLLLPGSGAAIRMPHGAAGGRPNTHRPEPAGFHPPPPTADVTPIKEMEIRYSNTTGPLTMKIEEVRRTGIDIGLKQTRDGRLIYEFDINFAAAPSLADLKPGMMVGVCIRSGAPENDAATEPMGGPPGIQSTQFGPVGDMGKPQGGTRGPGGKRQALEVWFRVKLAATPTGQ